MYIIKINAYENGSRPALQTWPYSTLPQDYAWCPDEFVNIFYSTNPAGFVNIEVVDNTVVSMTINQKAYDAYVAENPPEEEIL